MNIKTGDLQRLLYNAILYCRRDSLIGPTIRLDHDLPTQGLRVMSSDDYVGIVDYAEASECDFETIYLELPAAKELEKTLRELPSEEVLPGHLVIPEAPEPEGAQLEYWEQLGPFIQESCSPDNQMVVCDFAILPDRIRRMSLIKPGDFPIDFRSAVVNERHMLAFRAGPTAHGIVALLDRAAWTELEIYKEAMWG